MGCGPKATPTTAPVTDVAATERAGSGPTEAQLRAACDAGLFDACDAIPLEVMPDELQTRDDPELAAASGRGDARTVAALLESGRDANATDNGKPILHIALARRHWPVAERLLAAGANPNVLMGGSSTYRDDPALIVAMKNGGDTIIARLLAKGAKVDLCGSGGRTALHEAMRTRNKDATKLLIARGASVRYRNYGGRSALEIAAGIDDPDYLGWVIRQLGDSDPPPPPPAEQVVPPLVAAAHGCHLTNVELLLARGSSVNEREPKYQDSALNRAATHGCTDVVARLLQDKDIDVDHQDVDGDTALIGAAGNGHTKIVTLLLDAGADPTLENSDGNNALAQARVQGARHTRALLERQGSKLDPDDAARVRGKTEERWRDAPDIERCRGQRDAKGKRVSVSVCVRSEAADGGRRASVTLSDTTRLQGHQHKVLATAELMVARGEQVVVPATWNGTLASGEYFLYVPIVEGNPDDFTAVRAEIYVGRTIRSKPKRVWKSPTCRGCKARELQTSTKPGGAMTFVYITTDARGRRSTLKLQLRGGKLVPVRG